METSFGQSGRKNRDGWESGVKIQEEAKSIEGLSNNKQRPNTGKENEQGQTTIRCVWGV